MSTQRVFHTATLLPDGRVLVSGGTAGEGADGSRRAEIYDPFLDRWSPAASMSTGRYRHTATVLPDGRVLVSGGFTVADYYVGSSSAEIYEPRLDRWSPAASMSTGRAVHTATLLPDGRVLVTGDSDASMSSAEIYDPVLDSWSPAASMSTERYVHTATLLPDGRVLITGGAPNALSGDSNTTEIYDPWLDSWSPAASMSTVGVVDTATLLPDGRVLVTGLVLVGGGSRVWLASAEIYDPVLDSWSPAAPMNAVRHLYTATLLPDGRVLVSGGHDTIEFRWGYVTPAEIYDPSLDSWSPAGSMNMGRYRHTATLLPDGRVLVAGGSGASVNAEIYVPVPAPNTATGADVAVSPTVVLPNGTTRSVSLTFQHVASAGMTTATASSQGPPPPSGFKLTNPPVYYDVGTTATFTGAVRVCLTWTEGHVANESTVSVFRHDGGHWVDITDPASRDPMNKMVCGTTNTLSLFTLFDVKYSFSGFFRPVDNMPTVNVVKAGAAVPVKFSLGGDFGLNVFAEGFPVARLVRCATGQALAATERTLTPGSSSLSYDPATGHYTYVWKTDKAWGGSCRELQLMFDDGELYRARFSMR